MPPTQIRYLKVSFIWTETNLALFQSTQPGALPLGSLGAWNSYKTLFRQAQKRDPLILLGLQLPWIGSSGSFWQHYFEGLALTSIDGDRAWKSIVPLRLGLKGVLEVVNAQPFASATPRLEVYYYPFGWAVAVSLLLKSPGLDLPTAVDAVIDAKNTWLYRLKWSDQSAPQVYKLIPLAQQLLTRARELALGPNQPAGVISPQFFSLATVVAGDGVDPLVPVSALPQPDRDLLARALAGLANMQRSWRTLLLPNLADPNVSLDMASALSSAGDVLFASQHGRAVWYPGRFMLSGQPVSLSCYHNNLMIAIAHVDGLLGFLTALIRSGTLHTTGAFQPMDMYWCAKRAAAILASLRDGTGTYRSYSARAHIEQSDAKDEFLQAATLLA